MPFFLVIDGLFLISAIPHKYLTLLNRCKFELIPDNTAFLNVNPQLQARQLTRSVFLVQLFLSVKVMLHTLIFVHVTGILFFSKTLALLGFPTGLSSRFTAA
jgi:hypothetical protein